MRSKNAERVAKWRKANPDKVKAQNEKYYKKRKQKLLEQKEKEQQQ